MSGKGKVGRPRGPEIEDKISLRIKYDPKYPHLRKQLKRLAEKTKNVTFEDFCVGILKSYVNRQHFPLTDNNYNFYKKLEPKINSKKKEFEYKLKLEKVVKKQTLREFITINYPHPIKKKILFLELLGNHLSSEFAFLGKLLHLRPSLNSDNKINFLEYYREKFDLPTEMGYHYKAHDDLFSIYELQLNQYGIFTDESDFEIDFDALENFFINELYRDIKSSKTKSKEIYLKAIAVENKLEKRKKIREKYSYEYFHKYIEGSIEKLDIVKIKDTKKEIEEVEKKYLNNKNLKENYRYFEERKRFLLDRKLNGFTKNDFINELNDYFNTTYLSSMAQFELPFKFKLYFIPIAFKLDKYYRFLKDKQILFDFIISLNDDYRIVKFFKRK